MGLHIVHQIKKKSKNLSNLLIITELVNHNTYRNKGFKKEKGKKKKKPTEYF
jgi:hypothetical protein